MCLKNGGDLTWHNLQIVVTIFFLYCILYTEQKKKHNNIIPLNFEQIMIQSEIIAFSTSSLDIRLPNARN